MTTTTKIKLDYERKFPTSKRTKNKINVPEVGEFNEVEYVNEPDQKEDKIVLDGAIFKSVQTIRKVGLNYLVFTAYKSEKHPDTLLIVWKDFPFLHDIELGGDFMLQEMTKDRNIKYLIIDNTHVNSDWMKDEKVSFYLNNIWQPGLMMLGLKAWAHIETRTIQGKSAVKKFKKNLQTFFDTKAKDLGVPAFEYIPIEANEDSKKSFTEALKKVKGVK